MDTTARENRISTGNSQCPNKISANKAVVESLFSPNIAQMTETFLCHTTVQNYPLTRWDMEEIYKFNGELSGVK